MDVCECLNPNNVVQSFMNKLIYKDECMRCFASPEDDLGINVSLKSLEGYCVEMGHDRQYYEQTKYPLFLNIRKVPKPLEEGSNKITKLAIGKEGGADIEDKFDTITKLLCLACDKELDKTGAFIAPIIDSIVLSKSAFFESQVGEWELEIKECNCVKNLDQTGAVKIAEKSMAK